MSKTESTVVAAIVERLKEELQDVKEGIVKVWEEAKAFHIFAAIFLLREIIEGVILVAEEVFAEFGELTPEQRKEAVVEYLNSIIDIPVMPEFVEGWGLSWAYDFVYEKLTSIGGLGRGLAEGKKILEAVKAGIAVPTPPTP